MELSGSLQVILAAVALVLSVVIGMRGLGKDEHGNADQDYARALLALERDALYAQNQTRAEIGRLANAVEALGDELRLHRRDHHD